MAEIIAGCCNTLEIGPKNAWIDADKRHILGRVVKRTNKKIKSKVQKGDIAFGCCHDCIIRGNTILSVIKPDWFYGKNIGEKFVSDEQIVFDGELPPFNILAEKCSGEYCLAT